MREDCAAGKSTKEDPPSAPVGSKVRGEPPQEEGQPGQPHAGPQPGPEWKVARSSAESDGTETPPDQEAKTGFELPGDG